MFNSIFKRVPRNKRQNTPWIPLKSLEDLETIKEQSKSETLLIFKHSTRCGISRMVKQRFEGLFGEAISNMKVYYLDVLNYRDISNAVGRVFEIEHQSPQLLIIKNEVAILSLSHHDIITTPIKKYI